MARMSVPQDQISPFLEQDPLKKRKIRDNDGLHKRRGIWHYKLKIAGKWKELSTHKRNYQEARKARQNALHDQEQGRLPSDLAKWYFSKAAEQWLESRIKLVSEKTYKTEKERIPPLKLEFGNKRLCEIDGDSLQAYQLKRLEKVSPKTVNLETAVMRMILKAARLWYRLAEDFKALPRKKQGPGRALSANQEKRLFETACSNSRWNVAYYAAKVAANTTCRGCELKGLQLRDVDLIERKITIRRLSTKTDAGCRIIPLNDTAAWAFARLIERAHLLGATEPDHYLFPTFRYRRTKEPDKSKCVGFDPTTPMKSWRSAWRSLTDMAGLKGLRFHDLRHHSITRLAEKGVPEQTLMAIAGHVSKEMLEHYSHIRMQAKREAVATLEQRQQANSDTVKLPLPEAIVN